MKTLDWTVGTLARETGVSVRTLHYYDEIGLLSPSRRTESGHRLYTAADLQRLQQIVSLRQLGLALDEIHSFLTRPEASPRRVLELHVTRLKEAIEQQQALCARLVAILEHLRANGEMTVDLLLATVRSMTMMEKYYTPEQLDYLKRRKELVGEERIRQVQEEWPQLMAAVRAEMDRGTDPISEPVLALARRWQGLVDEFTGGDKGIEQSVKRLWQEQGNNLAQQHGYQFDPKMFEYIGKALAVVRASSSPQ
jgi:DNA-binding transcriptional MerR regulator